MAKGRAQTKDLAIRAYDARREGESLEQAMDRLSRESAHNPQAR